ncbi:MAG: phage protein [Pseudoduganella sp.]|jgi:DNA-binding transcriptional regulator YdaS (Cro superfamily)|nr:phage protein [Pseudoduganella sp.]
MEKTDSSKALGKAIECYRTLNAFATALGVPYQTVQQWMKNGVPEKWCVEIEKLTSGQVRCEELNDKVDWSYLRNSQAA